MSGLLDFADTLLSLGEEEYDGNTRNHEEEGWNVDEGQGYARHSVQSCDTGTNDGPPQHTKFDHCVADQSNLAEETEGCGKVFDRVKGVSNEAKHNTKVTNTFSHGSSIDSINANKSTAGKRQNVSKQASTVLLVDDLLSSLYLPQTHTTAHRTIKSLREQRKDTETSGKIQRSTIAHEVCIDYGRTGDKGNTKSNNNNNNFENNAERENSNNNNSRDSGNNNINGPRNYDKNRCGDTNVITKNNEVAQKMEKAKKQEEELRQKKQRDDEEKVIQLRMQFDRLWSDWQKSIDNPNVKAKLPIKDILEFGETLRRDYMKRTLRISNSARAQLNAKVMEQKIAQVFGLLNQDHPTTAAHTENQGEGPKYPRTRRRENLYIKFMLQKELSSLPEYKPKAGKARAARSKETNQEQQQHDGSQQNSPTKAPVSPSKGQGHRSPLRVRTRMTENVQQKEKFRAEELEKMAIEIETMLESMQETEEEALKHGNSEVDDSAGHRGRGNVERQHSSAPSITSEAKTQVAKVHGTALLPSSSSSTPSYSTRSTSSSASLESSPAHVAPPSYPPPNGVGRFLVPRGPNSASFAPPLYKSPALSQSPSSSSSSTSSSSSSSSSSLNTTERLQKLLALRQLLALPAARLRHLPAVQRELVSRCRPYTQYLNMSEGEVRQLPAAQQRAVEELYSVLGLDMEN